MLCRAPKLTLFAALVAVAPDVAHTAAVDWRSVASMLNQLGLCDYVKGTGFADSGTLYIQRLIGHVSGL